LSGFESADGAKTLPATSLFVSGAGTFFLVESIPDWVCACCGNEVEVAAAKATPAFINLRRPSFNFDFMTCNPCPLYLENPQLLEY
jgi:hypothetical protein